MAVDYGNRQLPSDQKVKNTYDRINQNSNEISALFAAFDALDTDEVNNDSTVAGTTLTEALNQLKTAIESLTSDDIANLSEIAGTDITSALDALNTRIDTIIASSGTSDTEVVDARTSTILGEVFTVLKDRLENIEKFSYVYDDSDLPAYQIRLKLVDGKPILEYREVVS